MEPGRIDAAWERGRNADRCKARRSDLDAAAAYLIDACRKVPGVRQIFAFGSYARGDVAPTSDLDAHCRSSEPASVSSSFAPKNIVICCHQNSFGRTILQDAVVLASFEADTTDELPHA